MYTEHDAARKRKLQVGSSGPDVETDEQLARRLHEELNALTRHSRRAAAVPSGPSTQRKAGKAVSAHDDKQQAKQQRGSDAAKQSSTAAVKQEAGSDREEKARKRCMLNRELAMLVVDMVEAQVKPVNGPRSKLKGEQLQDNHSVAVKHESSSSLSEQERLAIEHLHAAGADGKLVNKLLSGSHLVARTSDSGAAADSSTTGATSSGKGSGHEQEQQQYSGQQKQQHPQQQLQRINTVNSSAAASTRAAAAASSADCAGSRPIKIPKLPMVQYGKKWYRAKVLKDAGSKVMLEYQGYNHEGGPFWLNKDHARIWRGSYKGKDWRYLGDGAWEPKVPMTQEPKPRSRCRALRKQHSTAAGTASDATAPEDSDAEEEDEDEDEDEQQQQQRQQQERRQCGRRRAAGKDAAPIDDAAADGPGNSGHDTSSVDQEGEGEAGSSEQQQEQEEQQLLQEPEQEQQPSEVLTVDSPAVPESGHQPAVAVALQTAVEQQSPPRDAEREQQDEQLFEQQQQQEQEQQQVQAAEATDVVQEVAKPCMTKQAHPYVQQEQQDSEHQQQLDAEQQQQADVKQSKSQQRVEGKGKQSAKQSQQSKQQSQSEPKQLELKQQTSRCRRQSETDASDAGGQKTAASDSPSVKQSRRQASARAAEKAAERAAAAAAAERAAAAEKEAAAAAAKAAEAAAAAAAVPAADSSSERQVGDAPLASKAEQTAEKEEVLSAPIKSTSRSGRRIAGRHNCKSAPPPAAAAEMQPSAKRARGGRNKPAAVPAATAPAAVSDVSGKEQQPQLQQQQASVSNGKLVVDAGKALKHSSSSEGMPLSPTSPTAGGSPRTTGHRRKGKPQRARLDSDDLQQPAKKIKLGSSSSRSNGLAWAYSNSDAADILEMSFEQAPPPQPKPELEPQQQQQQQQQMHLGWKGGWKGAYKKGMWQQQQQQGKEGKQRDHAQSQHHKQQQEVAAVQQQQQWQEQEQEIHPGAAPVPVDELHMPAEQQQQPVLGGSDPDDVEAACVLVGASVGRTHSTEVYSALDMQQQTYQQQQQYMYMSEEPLSPRSYPAAAAHVNSRQNGRRRGHNWSKPLSRPPRPPMLHAQQQQQQHGFVVARRHSLNGSLQHGMYGGSSDLCNHQPVAVRDASYPGAAAVAPSPRFSRQPSLQGCSSGALPQTPTLPQGQQQQQQQLHRDGSYQLCNGDTNGKPATLRALLDAVGEVQANSGRPDLMYPLQYGGFPTSGDAAKSSGLQLPHVQVSAAAAALLAAVPSLETLQHMASARGQSGPLVACLSGDSSLSLFR